MVFFYQAEDGIRDTSVTGVQTCALPISIHPLQTISDPERAPERLRSAWAAVEGMPRAVEAAEIGRASCGKECGCRWRAENGIREDEKEGVTGAVRRSIRRVTGQASRTVQ